MLLSVVCRLRFRPGLFLNGLFSMRTTVCWSFLRFWVVAPGAYLLVTAMGCNSPQRREHSMCNRIRYWEAPSEIRRTNLTNSVGLKLPFVTLFRAVCRYRRGVLSSLCPEKAGGYRGHKGKHGPPEQGCWIFFTIHRPQSGGATSPGSM